MTRRYIKIDIRLSLFSCFVHLFPFFFFFFFFGPPQKKELLLRFVFLSPVLLLFFVYFFYLFIFLVYAQGGPYDVPLNALGFTSGSLGFLRVGGGGVRGNTKWADNFEYKSCFMLLPSSSSLVFPSFDAVKRTHENARNDVYLRCYFFLCFFFLGFNEVPKRRLRKDEKGETFLAEVY